MDYSWLDAYLIGKPGVQKDYKPEWEAHRYMLGGKMFAMHGGDKEGAPIFTFKLDPALGRLLRQEYKDIVPGYYMNKEHWNSLYLEGEVPETVVRNMADECYAAGLKNLSQKLRRQLLGEKQTASDVAF